MTPDSESAQSPAARGPSQPGLDREIARQILAGFDHHYDRFRAITQQAQDRFERADWKAAQADHKARINLYDDSVNLAVAALRKAHPCMETVDADLWRGVKKQFRRQMMQHRQPELAESFYNSVFCQVFERQYYRNEFIFVESYADDLLAVRDSHAYTSYYPRMDGFEANIHDILHSFSLNQPFEDLDRDIERLRDSFYKQSAVDIKPEDNLRIDILDKLFLRNKAAYVVGRIVSKEATQPCVVPLLINDQQQIYIDALLMDPSDVSIVFGFARSYFMVDAEEPFAYVRFLSEIMPHKRKSELYNALGLHKHGKTVFYRDLLHHMQETADQFVVAPGIEGMVMAVFTLPSYPYVFKIIKDRFAPSKYNTKAGVKEKYQLVKQHDRAGRMADTLEYRHVALPRHRFSDELIDHLLEVAPAEVGIEGDDVTIGHLYIERRMTPLNIYLDQATPDQARAAMLDYGLAIKEIAGTNLFPGDMLHKNFGVTRVHRVIFYDYDEVCYLDECNFRRIPEAVTPEQEMASEPWYSVHPSDVFPEEFGPFLLGGNPAREAFQEVHGDLLTQEYWQTLQQRLADGHLEDVFPYHENKRFCVQYGGFL
ncbi:MAG: bifunctional isocitrate dehydrogenase kinase/phosphatase [Natronospirillum sp.]|uniref:bifunctional isocitrate dehydrogenase kinase/phosphatase n=1 Tax=Natronospirillum sp. TaxID=2812955 RepID=UPI0025FABBDD|nr:bifunctional isocitrate dehydrogenase kinase/phosphatase [Natronospirillum sp.]MCH8552425.1 bifunctional isocitrate dehydrogenase kinase/phosphatase [Natronospirillum sp.]